MNKQSAIQAAVNAVAVATQAANDYGQGSTEYAAAHTEAKEKVTAARRHGATDDDLRNTRPA
ncbi:hypothetical protein O3Q52_36155 [Streptomyces sp. ActVer]|uniref:hypothetical protein n=1 Tax=Streptomyces sp. ActVer TaxID=3014558 RepID=UPI0022B3B717|nr:hypothetical protein [Streptomyces sp. ActVer]MCZ4513488.1 hypothetical protein [Streptomyces sp. ActVer]